MLNVDEMGRVSSHLPSRRGMASRAIRILAMGWATVFRIGALAGSSSSPLPNKHHSGICGSSSNSILAKVDSHIADQISCHFNDLNFNSVPIVVFRIAQVYIAHICLGIETPSFVLRRCFNTSSETPSTDNLIGNACLSNFLKFDEWRRSNWPRRT